MFRFQKHKSLEIPKKQIKSILRQNSNLKMIKSFRASPISSLSVNRKKRFLSTAKNKHSGMRFEKAGASEGNLHSTLARQQVHKRLFTSTNLNILNNQLQMNTISKVEGLPDAQGGNLALYRNRAGSTELETQAATGHEMCTLKGTKTLAKLHLAEEAPQSESTQNERFLVAQNCCDYLEVGLTKGYKAGGLWDRKGRRVTIR